MMNIKKPRGTQDFLPERAKQWSKVEEIIRKLCSVYGFGEIRTPIFEDTNLFLRGIGETTDVVQKEMYTFTTGEKSQSYTLRPENTASAVRAYVENKVYGTEALTKWFYIGPMFRHDKPQAGRYRQFHQFGVEVIGTSSPFTDSEVISLALQLFTDLGLQELSLELNSVGCPNCRPTYREALISYFEPLKDELCDVCQTRLYKNPLRILDCKEKHCQELSEKAPFITDYLCQECEEHFSTVKRLLDAASIEYELNPRLVRGLDYYTKTAFEIKYKPLGAQSAVAGGGRYDGLVESLGGPKTEGIGFGVGLERLMLALEKQSLLPATNQESSVFIVSLSDVGRVEAFRLQQELRRAHIRVAMDGLGKKMGNQLKSAHKLGATYALILGDDELERGEVILRHMETGEQSIIRLTDVVERIVTLMRG